jgi:hypothetical protein
MARLRSRTTIKRTAKAGHPHSWGVMLIEKRGRFLGYVDAPDRAAAEAAAARAFNLNAEQRKRLLVRERE